MFSFEWPVVFTLNFIKIITSLATKQRSINYIHGKETADRLKKKRGRDNGMGKEIKKATQRK